MSHFASSQKQMQVVRYQLVHWCSFGVELGVLTSEEQMKMVQDEGQFQNAGGQLVLQQRMVTPQVGEVLKQRKEAEIQVLGQWA